MPRSGYRNGVIAVGASAGGVAALSTLLGGISGKVRTAIVIVLHTQGQDMGPLISVLSRRSGREVREALAGSAIEAGGTYVAPGGYHLLVERDRTLSLSVDERVCHARPSVDVLFESVADAYAASSIGVVLTGSNADGAQGLACIRAAGGIALVQDPASAEYPVMPQAALDLVGAEALPLDLLARKLNALCTH